MFGSRGRSRDDGMSLIAGKSWIRVRARRVSVDCKMNTHRGGVADNMMIILLRLPKLMCFQPRVLEMVTHANVSFPISFLQQIRP